MARRSDASLAALLLTQRLVDVDADPLKASEYWGVVSRIDDPGVLLGRDAADVAADLGVAAEFAERIVARLGAATAFALELERQEQSGLRVLSSVDDEYPRALLERLGTSAPALLYVVGDIKLVEHDLLGVVGSRDVGEDAKAVAEGAARAAAASGWGVVSGAAKGIDRFAMSASLEAGAPVVGALAESLMRQTRDAEVRRAITDGQLCLLTPYKPSAGFSVASAMGRNKLIYALSKATLVVTSDNGKGGTWAGAEEALRHRYAPVLVWTGAGAGPGNRPLVERGGLAVDDVSTLPTIPEEASAPERPAQLDLGV